MQKNKKIGKCFQKKEKNTCFFRSDMIEYIGMNTVDPKLRQLAEVWGMKISEV